jgi:SPP1 gp7 family putative phage head morphogenesis protein
MAASASQRLTSPLDLATEHLAQVEALYLNIRKGLRAHDEVGSPVRRSRENIRVISNLYVAAKKARLPKHTRDLHEKSHAARMQLEQDWEAGLYRLSNNLFHQLDIEAAVNAAHRGWITPPPEPADGVLVDARTRKRLARFRKALTQPKPGDLEGIASWDVGQAARSQLEGAEAGQEVYVLRDAAGNPIGVATVAQTAEHMRIDYLATAPGKEVGAQMVQELARSAAKEGLGLTLSPAYGTDPFYAGLGMAQTESGGYAFSPEQAAVFAKTGGTLPPPGAKAPGLSPGENAVAQQMAWSAVTGIGKPEAVTAETIRGALASAINEEAWKSGAATSYLGLAMTTATASGQVSLEHLGLGKTWSWAHPQNMANDLFGVRGSKVIQNMYGNHMDTLTKIITEATDPRNPKNITEVKRAIREQWPDLQRYQVERIARTETGAVWMQTAANAYEANGISQFESIVAQGPRVGLDSYGACDYCVEASSSVRDITDNLPPWHPNCRCDIVPVLADPDSGEPWLPPDEPWTGGGDGSGPLPQGFTPKPTPEPPSTLPPLPEPPAPPVPPADVPEPPVIPPAPESPPAPPEPPTGPPDFPSRHREHWTAPETTAEPFGITAHGLTNDELFAIDKYVSLGDERQLSGW